MTGGAGRTKCPVCRGTSWMMCPTCRGSGRKPSKGQKPPEEQLERCEQCGGRGVIKCNHPRCQGGWVIT